MISLKTLALALGTSLAGFITTEVFAQKAYVKVGGNYNFGIGASIVQAKVTGTHNINNSATLNFEQVKINYGEGLVLNAAAGYYFTDHFGFEFGVGRLKGKTTKIENRIYRAQYALTEGMDYETSMAPITLIQPSLTATFGTKTIRPFARLGVIITSKVEITEKQKSSLWSYTQEYESKYSGNRGFGLQGAAGLDLKANEQVTFYLETAFNNLNYAPEKWEMTVLNEDGESKLHTVPANEREIVFSEAYTINYDKDGKPTTLPAQEVQRFFSLNTWSLGLGMKVTF
jgi:outer membrane protein W